MPSTEWRPVEHPGPPALTTGHRGCDVTLRVSPYPPQRPSQTNGNTGIVWVLVFAGLGFVILLGGLFTWGIARGIASQRSSRPSGSTQPKVALPPVARHVPKHALSLVDGCSPSDLQALGDGIDEAISIGAPLYNAGNFAGCYHVYEGTAADLEHRLPATCAGPSRALAAGRARAASLDEPSDQAWAMRDAFDGLLDVLERSASSR